MFPYVTYNRNVATVTGVVALFVVWATACEAPEQTIHIVAQDFVFTPTEVHASAERPIRLKIVNQGRERHEFKSSLLAHRTDVTSGPSSSLPVLPNATAEVVIRTMPGIYLYYCAIRGHAGMSGTIIVE
ncbi:MAG TPA: cupredoxin domain-containing protein [Nitrospira sp.]|nr:cupredoxin domain-containing protein [Nitrospira sp.]